jgi:thiamine biosynthesis lipoprotein
MRMTDKNKMSSFFRARRHPWRHAILICTLLSHPVYAEWFQEHRPIMGTRITVELQLDDATKAGQCKEAVFEEMHRIDELMSPYKEGSQLARINREAARLPVKISPELYSLIERAQTISELSGGAFDITFASVGYLYDYREHIRPSDEEIESHLNAIDYRHIRLDPKDHSIRFVSPGVRIDLGGIAKGYAVDNGIRILQGCGVKNGLVSAGGDSRIIGDKGGRPWMMGIQDPRKKPGVAVVLPLSDTAISTSGDYERYFIEDGRRYHHIISPSTGKAVSDTISASVIGPDATSTDALSTTVFVLGAAKGLKLIETLPGFDAIIIDSKGAMHYSSGFQPPAGK